MVTKDNNRAPDGTAGPFHFKRCDFDVRPAHDGATVLAMALKFRPHFILLDIKLPGIGGYGLAGSLR